MQTVCDTNILLRCAQPGHPMFDEALAAVRGLLARGDQLIVFLQNIAEFWNVATRPANKNGLGYTIEKAHYELEQLLQSISIWPDHERTPAVWRDLVVAHSVSGVQVHDARIVAAMKAHGLTTILTYNGSDFVRFRDIQILHPATWNV